MLKKTPTMAVNNSNSVADQLKQFIKENMNAVPQLTSGATLIRVPNELLEGNERYYKPRTVPIGPLHVTQDASLGSESKAYITNYVDEMKQSRLKSFLARLRPDKTPEKLVEKLTNSELAARQCYEGDIPLTSHDFLKIMLLDGCFIVELLSSSDWKTDEIIMSRGGSMPLYNLQQDLLKLENQLPFFILEDLHGMIEHKAYNEQSLVGSVLSFFSVSVLAGCKISHADSEEISKQSINHLLHLVMIALFPSSMPDRINIASVDIPHHRSLLSFRARSASELAAHGVKFQKRDCAFLSEIEFRNGVLEIPPLAYQESTATLFWNLLVHELYSEERRKRLFSSYVMFMDSLISNQNDVEVLLKAGILQTRVNDMSELVSFFNSLSANVIINPRDFCFMRQQQQMDGYCKSIGPRLLANGRRFFYEAKWDAVNGILLFILTVTQTLFSVLSYSPSEKKKNKET